MVQITGMFEPIENGQAQLTCKSLTGANSPPLNYRFFVNGVEKFVGKKRFPIFQVKPNDSEMDGPVYCEVTTKNQTMKSQIEIFKVLGE